MRIKKFRSWIIYLIKVLCRCCCQFLPLSSLQHCFFLFLCDEENGKTLLCFFQWQNSRRILTAGSTILRIWWQRRQTDKNAAIAHMPKHTKFHLSYSLLFQLEAENRKKEILNTLTQAIESRAFICDKFYAHTIDGLSFSPHTHKVLFFLILFPFSTISFPFPISFSIRFFQFVFSDDMDFLVSLLIR